MKKLIFLATLLCLNVMSVGGATIYVNGKKITGTTTFDTGGGSVSYTETGKQLIINGVTFERSGSGNEGIANFDVSGLTIVFRGSNTITIKGTEVITCKANTTISCAEASSTTLRCEAGNKSAIKTYSSTLTIKGGGSLTLVSTSGTGISGDSGSETCNLLVNYLSIGGTRGNITNLNTVNLNAEDYLAPKSSTITFNKTDGTSYPHMSNVTNLYTYNNMHITSPGQYAISYLTNSSSAGSAVVVSDEHENTNSTAVGNFRYKKTTVDGTTVALLVGPTLSYLKSYGATILVPGHVTLNGQVLPVHVGENAFRRMTFQWLYLSYGVGAIGNYAFARCPNLASVSVPSSVKTFGSGLFSQAGSNTSRFNMYWSGLIFSSLSLQSDSFTGISASNASASFSTEAARVAALQRSEVANKITAESTPDPASCRDFSTGGHFFVVTDPSAGTMTMVGSQKSAVTIDAATTYSDDDGTTYRCTAIAPYAFKDNTRVATLTINTENFTDIGKNAFSGSTAITTLNIKKSKAILGRYAFYQATALTDATLTGVTQISENCFLNCTKLKTVTLSPSLIYILAKAFNGCSAMTSITTNIPTPTNLSYGNDIFTGISNTACTLYVPAGTATTYKTVWPWTYFSIFKEITLLGDVNNDGTVNSADVAAIYTYILGGSTTYIARYDVNGDKAINAGDAAAVYSIILSE